MLMKIVFRTSALLLVVILITWSLSGAESRELKQNVAADHVSAAVWIFPVRESDYEIYVTFQSSEPSAHPAGCISVYRDFLYTLTDADGQIIPVDQGTIAHPPFEHPYVSLRTSDINRPYNCARDGAQRSDARAFLSKLYPKLAPGNYTLQVAFAPRWLGVRVPLNSMNITLPTGISP